MEAKSGGLFRPDRSERRRRGRRHGGWTSSSEEEEEADLPGQTKEEMPRCAEHISRASGDQISRLGNGTGEASNLTASDMY